MNNTRYIAIALIFVVSVFYYLLAAPKTDRAQSLGQFVEPVAESIETEFENAMKVPEEKVEVRSTEPIPLSSEQDTVLKENKGPDLEPITQQLALISAAYAAEIQYPPYSKPVSLSNKSYLEPNHFSAVEVPVLDGVHTASLSLAKFRFFYPEPIVVSLNTKLAISNIKYEFYDPTTKQVLAVEQTSSQSLVVKTNKDWPQEVRIKATIDFEQGSDILTADFNFYVPAAHLTAVGIPSSKEADMLIPLVLDVKQAGIYRIRANLYSLDGNIIAALNGKSKLGEGSEELILKAHQSVLTGTDGSYLLKDWVIERMSGYPGEKASFGISEQETIPLAPFDLSTLSKAFYVPSQEEQQRLDFLQQTANQ